ncbi:MAG: cytochrome c3 family protein [Sedimentisphaerales bacterium]
MSTEEFSSKWALGFIIAVLFMAAGALVALEVEVPFETLWDSSGHADPCSEAFRHWDDDGEVSKSCARCHSGTGFQDFIGADGSAVGTVDSNHVVGSLVDCTACHNSATLAMDTVTFPGVEPNYPGVTVTGLGPEARCMQCHQGRESTASVNEEIDDANVVDDDTIDSDLSFQNIHYAAAGATQLGGEAMGGYQYDGKMYDIKFAHTEGMDTCLDCHDPHTLEVKVEVCGDCHEGVADHEDLETIRFMGSTKDYDGDSDVGEGIKAEIEGIRPTLYAAIQTYARDTIGVPIVYDSSWYVDTDGDGEPDEDELDRSNRYASFSARLIRATFNYQFSIKDHGAFAHNAKYVIQLMYDSIEDLDPALVASFTRNDAGHFAGSEEPFRHWDDDGEVSGSCSKCHSASGLPFYLEEGVTASQPTANGLMCSTCHDAIPEFTRHEVEEVEFPSGAVLDTGDPNSNLCITCHQGRESAVSVIEAIAGLDPDDLDALAGKRYINVHYLPAGATFFGTEAKGAYEYAGKLYNGRSRHLEVPSVDSCNECHDPHKLEVKVETCRFCHNVVNGPRDIRRDTSTDYDGDGSSTEPLVEEIDDMHHDLYEAIQAYASTVIGVPIVYDSGWYVDTDGDGEPDEDELDRSNRYASFSPRLYQAVYNYHFVKKDPGGYAHNGTYILQVLYDGIESLGGDVSLMTRAGTVNTSSECGDATHPYPEGDLNQDCRVTFADIAILGANWLKETNP